MKGIVFIDEITLNFHCGDPWLVFGACVLAQALRGFWSEQKSIGVTGYSTKQGPVLS
jgi:hypothetical protein